MNQMYRAGGGKKGGGGGGGGTQHREGERGGRVKIAET